jgi:hypothetical protein
MLSKEDIRDIDDCLERLCVLFDKSGADRGVDAGILIHVLLLDLGRQQGLAALAHALSKWKFSRDARMLI